MNLPLYAAARKNAPTSRGADAHAGLWFSRFFGSYDEQFDIPDTGKSDWLKALARESAGDDQQLSLAAARTRHLIGVLGGVCLELQTDSPLATGLGLSHPVENGFSFHPTYGTPFLAGAAVKGLLRAWSSLWMEVPDEAQRESLLNRWFGKVSGDEPGTASAGSVIFFDALPTAPVPLACDVLTPHMGGWYEKGGKIQSPTDLAANAPADWHNPVPSPFLTVRQGASFLFAVAPRDSANTESVQDAAECAKQLALALDWIGIGAKTATGYGRLVDRKALGKAQAVQRLQEAGIAMGEEVWPAASLSWDKGKSLLTVVNTETKKKCTGKREVFQALSETLRKKLEKGKPALAKATVRLQGNQVDLVSLVEQE